MAMRTRGICALALAWWPLTACDCGPASMLREAGFDGARRDGAAGDAGCVGCDRERRDVAIPDLVRQDQPRDVYTDDVIVPPDAPLPDQDDFDNRRVDAHTDEFGRPPDATTADSQALDARDPLAPLAPTDLAAFSGAAIRLSYTAAAGATGYRAYVALAPGGPYQLAAPETTATAIEVRGLALGLSHFFVVRASNGHGESADSAEVSAQTLDGVAFWRGTIGGVVRRTGQPVAGASVRLYTRVDHGTLLAEASTASDGSFELLAPTGLYRGVIAGEDTDRDGNAFETGVDAIGVFEPASSGFGPAALEVIAGTVTAGITIDLDVAPAGRTIAGMVLVGAGWPTGQVVVEAFAPQTRLRPYRQLLAGPGPYQLDVPAGSYEVQAFLDTDRSGEQDVNEPRDRCGQVVDVTAASASGQDIVIPEPVVISGSVTGDDGWRVSAEDERWQLAASYSVAAPAGITYALTVPAGLSYTVRAFLDLDGNGRRSFYDADGDGRRAGNDEEWSDPGLLARPGIAAGSSGVDFSIDRSIAITGRVTPAATWRLVAREADNDAVIRASSDALGAFAVPVAADRTYYLFAYQDRDGDEHRTLGHEPLIMYGAAIDTSAGNVSGCDIVQRTLRGTIGGDRSDRGNGIVETVVAQQLVAGVGGGMFCAVTEFNNYARPASDGSFTIEIGAIGGGAGTLPLLGCQPACSGVTVSRYLDYGADYVHSHEGCGIPQPLVYPATPGAPMTPALLLDTSAGDVSDVNF